MVKIEKSKTALDIASAAKKLYLMQISKYMKSGVSNFKEY